MKRTLKQLLMGLAIVCVLGLAIWLVILLFEFIHFLISTCSPMYHLVIGFFYKNVIGILIGAAAMLSFQLIGSIGLSLIGRRRRRKIMIRVSRRKNEHETDTEHGEETPELELEGEPESENESDYGNVEA